MDIKEKRCPKCNDVIDHFDFDVTGTCRSQVYQSEVVEGIESDYDLDCLTDGVTFDNFSCPECEEVLFDDEDKARGFFA